MKIDDSNAYGIPTFTAAKSKRQKQRAAGLHPDYWYPALWSHELKNGEVREITFWKQSIAIYRGQDGKARALENRCAHRQLKLSMGQVDDCKLVCSYHGWKYEESGACVSMEHSLFGRTMPKVKVESFEVQERYGIVWVFPGNPLFAKAHKLPEIPEWADGSDWGKIPIDFLWNAHHSIIIDNTCDFTHAYLHRVRKPFTHAELTRLEAKGDSVELDYDTKVGQGRFSKHLVNRKTTDTNAMTLGYTYPYQWSSTDDKIKHWCFVLPIDEHTSRVFFLFYFAPEMFQIPFLGMRPPQAMIDVIMPLAKRLLVRPLLDEDRIAVEAEQLGYERHFDQPVPDLNPVVHAFQNLTVRKWEEFLSRGGDSKKPQATPIREPAAELPHEVSPAAE